MALVISPIARAMLTTKPVFVSIARMPAPIPRLAGRMTPITALVFGELNRPEPAPMIMSLFRDRLFLVGNLTGLLNGVARNSVLFLARVLPAGREGRRPGHGRDRARAAGPRTTRPVADQRRTG